MKKIAMGTIECVSREGPDINTIEFLLRNNVAFANATRIGKMIAFALHGEDSIDYTPVGWLRGKIEGLGAEVRMKVEEYEYVGTAFEFDNIKDSG